MASEGKQEMNMMEEEKGLRLGLGLGLGLEVMDEREYSTNKRRRLVVEDDDEEKMLLEEEEKMRMEEEEKMKEEYLKKKKTEDEDYKKKKRMEEEGKMMEVNVGVFSIWLTADGVDKDDDDDDDRTAFPLSPPHDKYSPFFPCPDNTLQINNFSSDFEFPIEKEEEYTGIKGLNNIVRGERLGKDVYDILSNSDQRRYLVDNKGHQVGITDAISAKYLLICCLSLPIHISDKESFDECRALISTYSDLKNKNINFEMVLVAKMNSAYLSKYKIDEKAAFDHFFSAFPCLAVPFSDSNSRDSICQLFGLGSDYRYRDSACVVLDPEQRVLQTDQRCFEYGAAAFPFTQDHLDSVRTREYELQRRFDPELVKNSKPLPLEELLCCKPDMILERFGGGEKCTVAELSKKKCVVLYICYDGKLFESELLENIRTEHVEKDNLEFEVVLVSLPIFSDQSSYLNNLKLGLQNSETSSWWWELPLVDEVSRRLYRLSEGEDAGDTLIVWADGGSTVEFQALPYIKRFGCDSYPYTRKHWLDDRISTLRSLTLESILGENARICGGSPPKDLGGVSDLKNRNILLYFSVSPHPVFGYFNCITLDYFQPFYKQMKEEYPGSEIIFVPLDQKLSDSNEVASLPWPRLSLPPTPLVDPKLLKWFQDQVIAFGADNQIKSVRHVSSLVRNESVSFRANNPMDSSYEKEGSSGGAGNQLGFVSTLRTSLLDDTLWEDTSSYLCNEICG